MARKSSAKSAKKPASATVATTRRPSALIDTRVIYCGDNLEQLAKLPDGCIDLIYIDLPFNSNRNYEVFWGESKEKQSLDDRHASTQAYIDYMRPRELNRLTKCGAYGVLQWADDGTILFGKVARIGACSELII